MLCFRDYYEETIRDSGPFEESESTLFLSGLSRVGV